MSALLLHNFLMNISTLFISRFVLYVLSVMLLGIIFSAYFAPELTIAITNQVWALCGW
ncbi:hypothetical protein CL55_00010030 [Polynucleobacter duraquae]|uniref:Uncharacterized protein n=1 Tax=Polynucleobacter duraquae TaxID=1835254 RepID=A0A0E3ZLT1_9BURK|nr:hypothetical protein CL55_00010030 [Polynucleobacter duraquae]